MKLLGRHTAVSRRAIPARLTSPNGAVFFRTGESNAAAMVAVTLSRALVESVARLAVLPERFADQASIGAEEIAVAAGAWYYPEGPGCCLTSAGIAERHATLDPGSNRMALDLSA
jgi:hypothetical protein